MAPGPGGCYALFFTLIRITFGRPGSADDEVDDEVDNEGDRDA